MKTSIEEELLNVKNRPLILFWTDKRYRFLRHFIFLVGFFVFLLVSSYRHDFPVEDRLLAILIICGVFVWLFYTNMYVLVPYLFMRGRHLLYLFALVILVTVEIGVLGLLFDHFFNTTSLETESNGLQDIVDGAFITLLIVFPSTAMKLFQRWAMDVAKIAELKELSNELELNLLKNQINPHFLFNMLNNVKSLIRQDPEKASKVILKLSDFLRHQLYEKGDENVSLCSEIEFLTNFLDLEKIRRDAFVTSIDVQQNDATFVMKDIIIPSNLFTTFVENAIKYSVDPDGQGSYIKILFTLADGRLHFNCRNSVQLEATQRLSGGGMGLVNIRRRLELLFFRRHGLKTRLEGNEFIVDLNITL